MLARHRRWFALGLVCLASLMIVLDATIVNVALPAIQHDLGFSQADLAWVVNAYLLTFGGCMLLVGRAADLLGRRRVLMVGIGLFTAASLACGLASSQTLLVAARAIQGVGGATVSAVSLSIVLTLFVDQADRARAMSIWGFVGSGGGTVGVIAGGLLTQGLTWHWIFLINVPLGMIALLLARPLLPPVPGTGLETGLDVGGALGVLAAPMLAVYAMVHASDAGWGSPTTLVCLALAVIVAAAWVWHEAHTSAPLVPLSLFRSRTVAVSTLVIMLSGASFFGWFFFSPLYAQHILGYDALQTGLTFLPATLTMAALSLGIAAWIVARLGPTSPLVGGTLVFTLGLLLFGRAPTAGAFWPDIALPMFLLGLGAGISFMPLFLIATGDVAPADSGLVSGTISTAQMIGGALGLALLAGLAAADSARLADAGAPPLDALNGGFHLAFDVGAGLALVTAVLAAWQLRVPRATPAPTRTSAPAPDDPELVGAGRS